MNATEAALLCRFVKAMFPAQQVDEYTPDAWGMALEDIPYDIARIAVAEVAKRHRFIAVSELRQAVTQMRRIAAASVRAVDGPRVVHDGDPDDVQAWMTHQRAEQVRLAELADKVIRKGAISFAKFDVSADPDPDSWENPYLLAVPIDTSKLQLAITGN